MIVSTSSASFPSWIEKWIWRFNFTCRSLLARSGAQGSHAKTSCLVSCYLTKNKNIQHNFPGLCRNVTDQGLTHTRQRGALLNLIEDFQINWVYTEKSGTGISLQNVELGPCWYSQKSRVNSWSSRIIHIHLKIKDHEKFNVDQSRQSFLECLKCYSSMPDVFLWDSTTSLTWGVRAMSWVRTLPASSSCSSVLSASPSASSCFLLWLWLTSCFTTRLW